MSVKKLRSEIKNFYTMDSSFMDVSLENRVIQNGVGFFPYGSGMLVSNNDQLPQQGLMVIGQDFGNVSYITENIINNGEVSNKTFVKTIDVIKSYSKEKVFLTNLFIGLRKAQVMTGKNPSLKNKELWYLDASYEYLKVQIEHVKPAKIIVLGKAPYNFICTKFNLKDFKVSTFAKYQAQCIPDSLFKIDGKPVLCIPHPSMWNSNVKNQIEWRQIIEHFIQ